MGQQEGRQLVDLLALEAMPEVAAALKTRKPAIVERWKSGVERLLPEADPLTASQVKNSIPVVLDHLARALHTADPAETKLFFDATRSHGDTRFHQNFNVRELIVEYRLLRRITVDELRSELGSALSITQVQAVDMGIDIAMQQAVVSFTEKQSDMLRAASDTQGRYLAFLSHDLRNNLNGVMLTLEVLSHRMRETAGFEEEVVEIADLQRSVRETVKGMDRLLQAERLRNKQVHLVRAPVNLGNVVADAVNQLQRGASEKGLRVETHAPPGTLTVESDRDLIALILQNLIGNAIKYSHRGTVRVGIRPRPSNAPGYVVSVSDEGPGIPAEHLGKIFAEFTRGMTYGQQGVGLGLAIASRAARAIGAELSVDSKANAGTTFELILPG